MGDPKAIEELLVQAKTAHGEYERSELAGVYDRAWPRWYAAFLVEHGLSDLVGRAVSADEVAALLEASWAEQERTAPDEPWETFTARHVREHLAGTDAFS
jgi:hypothetical protein